MLVCDCKQKNEEGHLTNRLCSISIGAIDTNCRGIFLLSLPSILGFTGDNWQPLYWRDKYPSKFCTLQSVLSNRSMIKQQKKKHRMMNLY